MRKEKRNRYVISVLVGDRVGILRDITTAVTGLGANIDGISQTVVQGFFTVILTATFDGLVTADQIRNAILDRFARNEAAVSIMPCDRKDRSTPTVRGERYIITVAGKERAGILKLVTGFLASKGINVEDWYVEFMNDQVVHIGEITVSSSLDVAQVQDEFNAMLSKTGLKVSLQHENLFRVTNEVGAIKPILGGKLYAEKK